MNKYQVFKSGPRKGQPRTLTNRVVRYLVEGLKVTEIKPVLQPKQPKYRHFPVKGWAGQFYFVGRNGGVRLGRVITDSTSWTETIHAKMKFWEAQLQTTVDKCNRVLEENK